MRIFCLVFIVFLQWVHAQENGRHTVHETISLADVLRGLEVRYNVRFSYDPKLVAGKRIGPGIGSNSLKEAISAIENIFTIIFSKIDDRYYIIKKRTKNISVCGYLKDKKGGGAIQGASVINKSTLAGTVTDKYGFFMLENNRGNDTLNFSFLGYKTLMLPVDQIQDSSCITYALSSENFALDEVVVQEYLGVGVVKSRDGSIKIDPNNLDILSGLSEPDILQNIQLLPGIESPNETASGLYIRGGSPDQNLILWDGIKMYGSNHFFGMISAFNPYTIKKVSISRSGTAPQYGDRISGVIDMTTDNVVPKNVEGQIGVNPIHADAYIKVPLTKDFGLFASVRRSLAEIFRSPLFINYANQVFQNTIISEGPNDPGQTYVGEEGTFNFFDVTLKAILNISKKDKIASSALLTRNRFNYRLYAEGFDTPSSDWLRTKNHGVNLSWSRFWNDHLTIKNKIYYSQYNFDYIGKNPFIEGEGLSIKKNNIKEIGYSVHTDWTIGDAFTFLNGYQFFSNRVAYALTDDNITDQHKVNGANHTLYSQLKYGKNLKWHIDVGLRSTYYTSLNSFCIEPRIYVERIFNEHFRLKASAELKDQAVSQIIEFVTPEFDLENQVWVLAEQDGIPLLKSDQLSGGFLFSKNGWHIDVDAYLKNIDGFTTLTRGFESATNDFSVGNSHVTGVDVLLKKKIKNYSTWLGYTYSTSDFLFNDIDRGKRFRGNNDIRHSLTWSQFYKWGDFQFSLGWKYRTGTPYTQATGFTDKDGTLSITYGAINSKSLPDYHRLDFSVLYNFKLGKKDNAPSARLGLSILNIYGRENILRRGYGLFVGALENGNTPNITLRKIDKYSLGTTPNIFFRVKF